MQKLKLCLAAIVTVVLILGCGDSNNISSASSEAEQVDDQSPSTGPERPNFIKNKTTYQKLAELRADQGISLDYLKAEFSTFFGPLDGSVSSGSEFPQIDNRHPSATHMIEGLIQIQNQLSASEQQRLSSVILPFDDIMSVESGNTNLVQSRMLRRGLDVEFNVLIDQASDLIAEQTGWPLSNNILGFFVSGAVWNSHPISTTAKGGKTMALVPYEQLTQAQFNKYKQIINEFGGAVGDCLIFSMPRSEYTFDELITTVAHEVFHCFQNDIKRARKNFSVTPQWVSEGMAAWAEHALYPGVNTEVGWWKDYQAPKFTLANSSYDAFGFWSHVDDVSSTGLWSNVVSITGTPIESTAERVAFIMDIAGAGKEGYDTWLPMAANRPAWGAALWQTSGVGGWQVEKELAAFQMGSRLTGRFTSDTGVSTMHGVITPKVTDPKSSVFSVGPDIDGIVYAHWEGDGVDYKLENNEKQKWCVNGPCVCEDGSIPPVLQGIPDAPKGERLYVAIGPGFGSEIARTLFSQIPIKEYCEEDTDPNAPPGRSSGIIYGDPRLLTFDNHPYNFQAVGEFILAKSTLNDFEAQVRFAPVRFKRTNSIASAVAMNVSQDIVQIDNTLLNGEILINGVSRTLELDDTIELTNGGDITYRILEESFYSDYVINWPDSSTMVVSPINTTLKISTYPADAHADKLSGLLGDFDGDADDEPQYPDGTPLYENGIQVNSEALYTTFAAAYRISESTSLFTYGPDESSASFTDKTFPDEIVTLDSIGQEKREAAQATCNASGIVDFPFLESCILDFATTNDQSFVDAALSAKETKLIDVYLESDSTTVSSGNTSTDSLPNNAGPNVPGGVCPCADAFGPVEMNSPPWQTTSLILFDSSSHGCSIIDEASGAPREFITFNATGFAKGCFLRVESPDALIESVEFLETDDQQGTACAALVESKARDWFRNGNTLRLLQADRTQEPVLVTSESQIQCN